MAAARTVGPVGPGPETTQVNTLVDALSALFDGGEVTGWALVTEQASVVGAKADDGSATITIARVIDSASAARRLVRARPGSRS